MKTALIQLGCGMLITVVSLATKWLLLFLVGVVLLAIGGNGIKKHIKKS